MDKVTANAKLSGEQPPSHRRRRVASPLEQLVRDFITMLLSSTPLFHLNSNQLSTTKYINILSILKKFSL